MILYSVESGANEFGFGDEDDFEDDDEDENGGGGKAHPPSAAATATSSVAASAAPRHSVESSASEYTYVSLPDSQNEAYHAVYGKVGIDEDPEVQVVS